MQHSLAELISIIQSDFKADKGTEAHVRIDGLQNRKDGEQARKSQRRAGYNGG
ncbi:MAG: hypothetical protein LBL15_01855 [Oscillospiraceae bacterium]|nr:hypothetical protein [Oscillospiraceae bacterium]